MINRAIFTDQDNRFKVSTESLLDTDEKVIIRVSVDQTIMINIYIQFDEEGVAVDIPVPDSRITTSVRSKLPRLKAKKAVEQ